MFSHFSVYRNSSIDQVINTAPAPERFSATVHTEQKYVLGMKRDVRIGLYSVDFPQTTVTMRFSDWLEVARILNAAINGERTYVYFRLYKGDYQDILSPTQRKSLTKAYEDLKKTKGKPSADPGARQERADRFDKWFNAWYSIDADLFDQHGNRHPSPIWNLFVHQVFCQALRAASQQIQPFHGNWHENTWPMAIQV